MEILFTHGDKKIRIAQDQVPPFVADEYWDKPGESSLRYASDMHLGKMSTNVVLNGQAWAPKGKMAQCIDMPTTIPLIRSTLPGDRCCSMAIFDRMESTGLDIFPMNGVSTPVGPSKLPWW